MVEITYVEQNKGQRIQGNEDRLRDLWDNKHTNICITGVPEGKERGKGSDKIFQQIIAENFPNVEKKTVTEIQ